ncbi:ABC transporter ATP-binding protein [Heyndrickxia shackletonii]|uniref:ABC transporter ATP-binding protein n=1 Tax=Heyndrickxia shackletonii TaxID=157838 RepID=A0A0Q3TJZ1_9BACI|nr:ABC transporter ATP-binding protein [Heyndrickxia shackletonii]KQL54312.1 ABC transporter ATP-binding protein [Heyndrickxia shackletonii]NEZ01205.1 ABC transporter ATP-binding protein [Heyndrickxia shackletonii]
MTLHLEKVSFTYDHNPIVSNFSITVEKGEFVSLIGKSGSGKSTILKLIAGLLQPKTGQILMDTAIPSPGSFGYMPQQNLLLPWRTVLENLMLHSEIQKGNNYTKEDVREWLRKTGLAEWENALPKQLSGGMKQRIAFLRTILTGSEVLLLDEPFGALDAFTKRDMQKWLLSIWQELDKTILFITHDLEEAILLSDRILIIHPQQGVEELKVDLPRPREAGMIYTAEMVKYRQELERRITDGLD